MIDAATVIPNRALFKPAEVCQIAQLQPYMLRSWETEFPEIGVVRAGGNGRLYRRTDVERVLQIKHLLFVEGLTVAGIRRRIDDETAPVAADVPIDELLGLNARELPWRWYDRPATEVRLEHWRGLRPDLRARAGLSPD